MRELPEQETFLNDYLLVQTAETLENLERIRRAAANLSASGAATGQIAVWDGAAFVPGALSGDGNGITVVVVSSPFGLQVGIGPNLTISGLADVGDLKVGGAETIKIIDRGTVNADPGSINAQTRGFVDVTINGVAVGDIVVMNPPDGLNTGLAYSGCRVTGTDTVRIYLANITGSAIDDGSLTWDYLWLDLT